ncbi:MAG: recombinase family protein [Planctomycetota bacterium]
MPDLAVSTDDSVGTSRGDSGKRAAQYVRMSTEHQQYSTENQSDVITEYAARRGYTIVRTYADEGKSGLRIEGRDALKRLIGDVKAGNTDYEAVLVYDVSRWGRFQDADESAYYEFLCKQAGITVHYCAEQFENDGSPTSDIIKSVKRSMAGEYSRALSDKVFKGQCKLIQLGYRQGGTAGYGLRRMLVDQNGEQKGILEPGEHKSIQTDRVILVPGLEHETEVVERIYDLFISERLNENEIAGILNADNIPGELGRRWTRSIVHQILTNEKYIGNNVYNRISFKLKRKRVQNPPDMWVRAANAFPAIIDPALFYTAQGIILARSRTSSDEEMIDLLTKLYQRKKMLTSAIIDADQGMPSSSAYRGRFGTLIKAYLLAGYDPGRDYSYLEVNRSLRQLHPRLLDEMTGKLESHGAKVGVDEDSGHLRINDEYTVSVMLSRHRTTSAGSSRWLVRFKGSDRPDITLMVRMDAANEHPEDYYLLPHLDLRADQLRLHDYNGFEIDTYRFTDLAYFVDLSSREQIEAAA